MEPGALCLLEVPALYPIPEYIFSVIMFLLAHAGGPCTLTHP